ncbi:MAG: Na+-transporting NADH:ubiquinone oxidoreductase subunit D [Bacteroidetes bacterium GWE2_39_28]|jgi:electron transport complex protein RnfD|nr:MAG: Na+-transporting NADH:ubiquinone oxidoreductase subunit D [Bacteroidetes bacterium GWE2_39_28]OFY12459.1 MAG: Na+-transporting NADH:ubiquinone oxidoreductase subunit D [Bacteroidetes bacterium GWF2_39_10]OFZ08792.1 MAG: Na+-transporting NADH:ubiquinone oxidoreductase subunit D [Bacteroidetes bacterium RIFOXYB2_FULL_39_7]OFZ10681.1 MAG: Na+-transporting NADH:ubiquinone oxidoreductase subunit D [Bacteroidetes bacterium RIFOXYC2_FULL_39_11]HCT93404.1 Na+-transporting NADH:ubiquinone oxidor
MKKLLVSPAPHIHGKDSTQGLMRDVIIALSPSLLVSIYFFGFSAIKLAFVGAITCLLVEFAIQKYIIKGKVTVNDYSAALTGLLLALNLPPNSPSWLVFIGAIVAIGVAKMSFGGIGQNLFNPALVGRVFLLVSFPVIMTDWTTPVSWFREGIDATSGATALSIVKEGLSKGMTMDQIFEANNFSYAEMLFSKIGGSVGEVSALALLVGLVYLLIRRVIRPHIPLSIIGSVMVLSGIFWIIDPTHNPDPIFTILTGGLLIGSIFMATDYVTSPMSTKGMIIFGVGIGVITVLIRNFGAYPEGISFAILIMNATVPLLNNFYKPKRFGKEVKNG